MSNLDPRDRLPDAEWKVCGVCGRMLEKLDRMDPVTGRVLDYTWLHPYDMRHDLETGEEIEVDHPVTPVDRGTVPEVLKCDFCFADDPIAALPVEDFEIYTLGNTTSGSHSDWAACEDCAELIRRGYWSRLTDRVIKAYGERHEAQGPLPPEMKAFIRDYYRRLTVHVTGPLRDL